MVRRRGLTLDQLWLFAALAFIALRAFLTPISPHDFWWHMATGREIAATGQVPAVDGFSYTRAGEPFFNQSWLAQLLLYGLFWLGGLPLIIFFQALVLILAYGLLIRLCVRRGASLRLAAGFVMAATMPASFDNWVVRPQTYALPLFVAFLYLLTIWREGGTTGQGRRLLWLLPLLALVWVNIHGSFVLGGALVALTFLGEAGRRFWEARRAERAWAERPVGRAEELLNRPEAPARPPLRDLVIAGALVGAAWLLNPGGWQVLGYVRNLLSSSAVTQLVTEWAPQTVRDPNGVIFFLFVLLGIGLLSYGRRRPDPVEMLLTGALFWLALGAVRNNIWFIAAATPLLVMQMAGWRGEERPKGRVFQGLPALNAALAGLIGLLLLLTLPWVKPALDLPPTLGALLTPDTPVAAVERLQADGERPERLFHAMSYGSYLIWKTPEQKVWIDPRIELYPLEQWLDYQRLSAGEDADRLLEQYGIDGLLLSVEQQAGLIAHVRAQPQEWEPRYEDEISVYVVRR